MLIDFFIPNLFVILICIWDKSDCSGHLYVKSDVYGFGVLLLELLSGLRALDDSRPSAQYVLVDFARPFLADCHKLIDLMDPRLGRKYPLKAAQQAAQLILSCISVDPKGRPSMKEVVEILEQIAEIKRRPKESKPRSLSQDWNQGHCELQVIHLQMVLEVATILQEQGNRKDIALVNAAWNQASISIHVDLDICKVKVINGFYCYTIGYKNL